MCGYAFCGVLRTNALMMMTMMTTTSSDALRVVSVNTAKAANADILSGMKLFPVVAVVI